MQESASLAQLEYPASIVDSAADEALTHIDVKKRWN